MSCFLFPDDEWEDINESESSSDDAMETGDVDMDTENDLQVCCPSVQGVYICFSRLFMSFFFFFYDMADMLSVFVMVHLKKN